MSHRDTIIFAASARLPFHGIQLHLVGKGFLRGENAFTLQVAVHHDNDSFIISQIADKTGHGALLCQLAGHLAAVAGYHFIPAALLGAYHAGNKNTVPLDAVGHFQHGLVHPHLKGMIGKVADLVQRDVHNRFSLCYVPFLLRDKQLIYRGQ